LCWLRHYSAPMCPPAAYAPSIRAVLPALGYPSVCTSVYDGVCMGPPCPIHVPPVSELWDKHEVLSTPSLQYNRCAAHRPARQCGAMIAQRLTYDCKASIACTAPHRERALRHRYCLTIVACRHSPTSTGCVNVVIAPSRRSARSPVTRRQGAARRQRLPRRWPACPRRGRRGPARAAAPPSPARRRRTSAARGCGAARSPGGARSGACSP
jgi:hypothetical protein